MMGKKGRMKKMRRRFGQIFRENEFELIVLFKVKVSKKKRFLFALLKKGKSEI